MQLLTLPGASTSNLRPLALGALLAAAMVEAYWVLTVQVLIPPRGSDLPVIWVCIPITERVNNHQ